MVKNLVARGQNKCAICGGKPDGMTLRFSKYDKNICSGCQEKIVEFEREHR